MLQKFDELILEQYKQDAEKLGLTLSDYMLFRVLQKLDDLQVVAYSGE